MGLFFRKSLRFGPLRINFSKSGIGLSAGVKGLRIGTGPRGRYISGGRYGIYYRQSIRRAHHVKAANIPSLPPLPAIQKQKGSFRTLPLVVAASIAAVVLIVRAGVPQSTVGIVANLLFVLCICAFLFDRRKARKESAIDMPNYSQVDPSDTTPNAPESDAKPSLAELLSRPKQRDDITPPQTINYVLPGADLLNPSEKELQDVSMRGIIESEAWRIAEARLKMPIVLGRDDELKPVLPDLADLPHVLIAGTTGSGKSVCIDGIITSLLLSFTPETLRFVLFDLRGAQFQIYKALPHLAFPVVTDAKQVLLGLRWLINEAERRYQIFARAGVRDIWSFNTRPSTSENNIGNVGSEDFLIPDQIPFVVVIVDELAELIGGSPDVELAIARLAENGRAVGIHLILSTQTPRTEVITGLIKSNFPTRIAFKVVSRAESQLIIDQIGAEHLRGPGDMLFIPVHGAMTRAQGVFVTEDELQRIVRFLSAQMPPLPLEPANPIEEISAEDEELLEMCIEIIRQERRASTSLLQRRLRLGYTRAAHMIDILEQRGILGPGEGGATPREILVDLDTAS